MSTKALIKFEDTELALRISEEHEFTLTTKEVAAGYGVKPDTIRQHKKVNSDEFIEGKHFLSSVSISHGAKGTTRTTIWTKRGIIRLGFFIKSERARRFRDFIEDLTMLAENAAEKQAKSIFDFAGIDFNTSTSESIENASEQSDIIHVPAHKYISLLEYKIEQLEKQCNPKRINLTNDEIKTIKKMAKQGYSVSEICKSVNRSESSVRKFAGHLIN